MKTKTLEIKALVTQTIERTYKIEVPVEESKEEIQDLFESGNISDIYISNESDTKEFSKELISVVDISALKREAEERQNEIESKREAKQDGVGRFGKLENKIGMVSKNKIYEANATFQYSNKGVEKDIKVGAKSHFSKNELEWKNSLHKDAIVAVSEKEKIGKNEVEICLTDFNLIN